MAEYHMRGHAILVPTLPRVFQQACLEYDYRLRVNPNFDTQSHLHGHGVGGRHLPMPSVQAEHSIVSGYQQAHLQLADFTTPLIAAPGYVSAFVAPGGLQFEATGQTAGRNLHQQRRYGVHLPLAAQLDPQNFPLEEPVDSAHLARPESLQRPQALTAAATTHQMNTSVLPIDHNVVQHATAYPEFMANNHAPEFDDVVPHSGIPDGLNKQAYHFQHKASADGAIQLQGGLCAPWDYVGEQSIGEPSRRPNDSKERSDYFMLDGFEDYMMEME